MKGVRYAIVKSEGAVLETIQRYLPSNYKAEEFGGSILIRGVDVAGWTLDEYVIPRLASGWYTVKELVEKGAE